MTDAFDPYYTWLGIPPEEQPPDHYRLLGLRRFEKQPDVISNALDQRTTHLRSFRAGPQADEAQAILDALAVAGECLLNAGARAAYDRELRKQDAPTVSKAGGALVHARPQPLGKPSQVPTAAEMEESQENQATSHVSVAAQANDAPGITLSLATSVSGPRGRANAKRGNVKLHPAAEVAKIVLGGAAGLFIAVLLLAYFTGNDLLGWGKPPKPQVVRASDKEVAQEPDKDPAPTPKQPELRGVTKESNPAIAGSFLPAKPIAPVASDDIQLNTLPTKPAAETPDPERMAAEFVLSKGGKVRLDDPSDELIESRHDLPSAPFRVTEIRCAAMTDAALGSLRGLKSLSAIDLSNSAISDAGLPELAALKSLKDVTLRETKVTVIGINSLRQNLPDCKVEWESLPSEPPKPAYASSNTISVSSKEEPKPLPPAVLQAQAALTKAREDHSDALADIRSGVLKKLSAKEANERKRKDPDLGRLRDLKSEMDALEESGELPEPIDPKTKDQIKKAGVPLLAALNGMKKAYIEAKQDAEAAGIEKEIEAIQNPDANPVPKGPKYYKIINKNSGLALEVAMASVSWGAKITQDKYTGKPSQEWELVPINNGPAVHVRSRATGLELNVAGGSKKPGTGIVQWPHLNVPHNDWVLHRFKQYCLVQSVQSGHYLAVPESSKMPGANVIQWSPSGGNEQLWEFVEIKVAKEKPFGK